jgi:hypothetical protein
MSVRTPPKPGRYKEQRIIAGTLHNVITENGKIVKDLGAAKRDQISEQEQPTIIEKPNVIEEKPEVIEEKPTIGIPLISEDGTYLNFPRQQEATNDDTITKPNSISQEQKPNNVPQAEKPKSGLHLTPLSLEDIGNIFKQDKQVKHNPDSDREQNAEKIIEPLKESVSGSTKTYVPVMGQKPSQIPKVPKLQINIPPNPKNEPVKLENIPNKLSDIITTDTVVDPNLQKANENIWSQQPVTTREKSTKEKRRFMSEELEAELLDERKFEQWMKKQKFHENLEKAAQFAEQTKEQFEEKIPELSNKIEDVTGEVKSVENKLGTFSSNVDNRLGTVDKSIETLCTGIDCVKEDVKKYQTSHDNLEKLVQDKFGELSEKVQSLERPTFTCENCGEPVIAPLSSYCPNCGSEIQSWSDEDGQPVRGWTPYWKRLGRSASQ